MVVLVLAGRTPTLLSPALNIPLALCVPPFCNATTLVHFYHSDSSTWKFKQGVGDSEMNQENKLRVGRYEMGAYITLPLPSDSKNIRHCAFIYAD